MSPTTGNRIVCYCDDCQAFARFLERPDILDSLGGTDIFQMAVSRLRITQGESELRCMRLSPKGLIRWYTACCKTPVGNTVGGRLPLIGLIHSFMDHESKGRPRDQVLGKPAGYVFGRFARGGLPAHAHPKVPLGLVVRVLFLITAWLITSRGKPSPLFDSKTKAARVEPLVLHRNEREALCGA